MKLLYIILVLFLSAMIGTCIGEFLLFFIPEGTVYYSYLSKSINPLWSIDNLDLIIFNLNFSLRFNINSFTLIGLITGAIYSLRKV